MSTRQFTIFFFFTVFANQKKNTELYLSATPASAQLEKKNPKSLLIFFLLTCYYLFLLQYWIYFVFLNQSFSLQESSRETKNYVHCKKFAKIWVNIESIQDQSNSGCCILWQIFVKWSRGMKREMKWLTMSLIILNVGQSMAYI